MRFARLFHVGLISTAAAAIALSAAMVVLTPPAHGYEFSALRHYPAIFPVLLAAPVACWLSYGMLIGIPPRLLAISSLASTWLFLWLPAARGYVFYNSADSLTHLGHAKAILLGHVDPTNVYPLMHVLLASVAQVTGLKMELVFRFAPSVSFGLYLAGAATLARSIGIPERARHVTVAIASIPVLGGELFYVVPSAFTFFLLPLIGTAFVRVLRRPRASGVSRASIALMIFLVALPFGHPEVSFFIILGSLVALAHTGIFGWIFARPAHDFRVLLGSTLVLFVSFIAWFAQTPPFAKAVGALRDLLLGLDRQSELAAYSDAISRGGAAFVDIAMAVITNYGSHLILGLVAMGAVIHGARVKSRSGLSPFIVLWAVFGAIAGIFLIVDLLIGSRPLKYFVLLSTLLIGLGAASFEAPSRRVVVILLVGCLILSTATALPSPLSRRYNWQVPEQDFAAMAHFLETRDPTLTIEEFHLSQRRFADAILLPNGTQTNIRFSASGLFPPDHFDWQGANRLDPHYFLLNSRGHDFYPNVYPDFAHLWRFTPGEFDALDGTNGAAERIYDAGEAWIYYVSFE